MVYKITQLDSRHKIFIETLILTILILLIGFLIGFYVESARNERLTNDYKWFEIEALDLKLQNYYYQTLDASDCKTAIEENLRFADDIYNEGITLQRYEDAGELLEDSILLEKKRYILLKTELWLNSILLKEKCNNPFHTVTYIYTQYPSETIEAQQAAIANILRKIKEEKGNDVILLPIAGDIGLNSVDIQLRRFNNPELPVIIIDEKIILSGFSSEEEIKKHLD